MKSLLKKGINTLFHKFFDFYKQCKECLIILTEIVFVLKDQSISQNKRPD